MIYANESVDDGEIESPDKLKIREPRLGNTAMRTEQGRSPSPDKSRLRVHEGSKDGTLRLSRRGSSKRKRKS